MSEPTIPQRIAARRRLLLLRRARSAGAVAGAAIDWTAIGISVAGWAGVYGLLSFGTGGRGMGYGDAKQKLFEVLERRS